ncbi:MAG: hypothetical protein [Wendovervirus sonii]|uniref:Microbial-type PARG catalytic domain-containing protein n=1 Tax=phage Lak_Megaphage_Sonny TaxID=3109229 RepID=A0ABZ0Z593_9CAUD|nr:MAG: hypothetical protein [phage Lak_Megaphage_Sonny]
MGHYRKDLEDAAIKHVFEMNEEFSDEIKYSIENSKIFRYTPAIQEDGPTEYFNFQPTTTTVAIMDMVCKYGKNIAALNYASYKWAGGGFIKGSMAQEEALCHDSTLYNVIGNIKFEHEYKLNRNDLHKSMYTNFAIFSPDVVFVDDEDWYKVNVLTCPAPNYKAGKENGVSYKDNLKCLKERAEFMIKVAKANNTEVLILGAWGCGVFGQNEHDLAIIFKDILNRYKFKEVLFAIPDNAKLNEFKKVF